MQTISDLKMLLLQIIEDSFQQEPNIQATQQMGVNISNAVKKDGVVIIQNQNLEIYARIMPLMVKALRTCDILEAQQKTIVIEKKELPPPEPILLPEETDTDPIEDCCSWFFENNIKYTDMLDLMKKRYLDYVVGKTATKKEAAQRLDIGATYLSKLTKSQPVVGNGD